MLFVLSTVQAVATYKEMK